MLNFCRIYVVRHAENLPNITKLWGALGTSINNVLADWTGKRCHPEEDRWMKDKCVNFETQLYLHDRYKRKSGEMIILWTSYMESIPEAMSPKFSRTTTRA